MYDAYRSHRSGTSPAPIIPSCSRGSSSKKVSLLAWTQRRVKDSVRTTHPSRLGDIGNEPLAESCLLDLPWGMAHIDDQPVDLQHPDEGVLINH